MIYCDSVIEEQSIFLENIDLNASSVEITNVAFYGFYNFKYKIPLIQDHIYYYRLDYKFTTTGSSPSTISFYSQGGYVGTGYTHPVPAAGTWGTFSAVSTDFAQGIKNTRILTEGHVYQLPQSNITNVTSYAKNGLCYDVTNLYYLLLSKGVITNRDGLKNWCDSNLTWIKPGERQDITSKVSTSTSIKIKSGNLIDCEIVECDGMQKYSISDAIRNNTYFDSGSGISVYNNSNNGAVTHSRVSAKDQNSPFFQEHPYVLKITTNGTATPSCGGFCAMHTASANKVFIERFVAKVPKGYTVTAAFNGQGTGAAVTMITPAAGTGNWEEYAVLYKCGSSGTFSTGGHVYLKPDSGYSATSVTWYLAYVNSCDITTNPNLAYYTVLPNKDAIKGKLIFSREFNTRNLVINGDGSNPDPNLLPSGWTWDTNDVAGNAKASIVQGVNVGPGTIVDSWNLPANGQNMFQLFKINPNARYKLSYWIKCKKDQMLDYSAQVRYYVNSLLLQSTLTGYRYGTRTKLTADLKSGDTQMSVASNSRWADIAYGNVGLRSYHSSYNDITTNRRWNVLFGSTSSGNISGIEGSNIVKFKSAYSGTTVPSGTTVVESYDHNTYYYPFPKSYYPTEYQWVYVEKYFNGDGVQWDGNDETAQGYAIGSGLIPFNTTHIGICLNCATNTGSDPIKWADIRLEEIGEMSGERYENKLEFKKTKIS